MPSAVLHYAATLARRQGVTADAALLGERLVEEEIFYRALAAQLGVPFWEDAAGVTTTGDAAANAAAGVAPLADHPGGLLWLFAPTGPQIMQLIGAARAARGQPRFAVTTRAGLLSLLRAESAGTLARQAALSAEAANPGLCARPALERWTLAAGTGLIALLGGAALGPQDAVAQCAAALLGLPFLCSALLRLLACAASFERWEPAPFLDDAQAPFYTLIVALYREARVVRQLGRALDRLDYPRAKLDVKFVLEADDLETLAALRAHPPRVPFEILIAPEVGPRTKPRALNVAAPFARGSLIAVYDAEDLPQPGQLRRAAAVFSTLPREVACLQASLVIDNGGRNPLTMLYALDYAGLFDVYNKGLAALGLPMFLGGTSNHFRIEALRAVGFWDAYNVTEDADLGLRLARAGFRIETFASATFEEAPERLAAVLKQRTRWMKGWMQTALVHCRRPDRLLRDLGWARGAAALAMFAGAVLAPLLGPPLFARFCRDAIAGALFSPRTAVEIAFSTLAVYVALAGAFAIAAPLLLGMRRRRIPVSWSVLLAAPLWLVMLSLAAWRALAELWLRPFHWEKTEHGLSPRRFGRDSGARAPDPATPDPGLQEEPSPPAGSYPRGFARVVGRAFAGSSGQRWRG